MPSGTPLSSGLVLSQAKSLGKSTERSLGSVLHASKQKISAIESMPRGLDKSDKPLRSTSLDLGVDTPSAGDPPFPLAVPSSSHLMDSVLADSTASNISRGSSQSSGLISTEPFSSYTAKRTFERLHDGSHIEENTDMRINSHYLNTHG